jgi:hypothetical protein
LESFSLTRIHPHFFSTQTLKGAEGTIQCIARRQEAGKERKSFSACQKAIISLSLGEMMTMTDRRDALL